jgi:hypothetical protein
MVAVADEALAKVLISALATGLMPLDPDPLQTKLDIEDTGSLGLRQLLQAFQSPGQFLVGKVHGVILWTDGRTASPAKCRWAE